MDVERVKALTLILEEAKDKRAEKGHKILKEISTGDEGRIRAVDIILLSRWVA